MEHQLSWVMKKKILCVLCGLCLVTPALWAQMRVTQTAPSVTPSTASSTVTVSALDAELFYRLLVGEISAREGDAAAGFALMLDSARKTNDPQLYQRAVEIALQSRSGDAALQAAQAWKQAQPTAQDPNRYVLQILIALNRIEDTLEPLKNGIELTPEAERSLAISAIPRAYARVTDKKMAGSVVENALSTYMTNPATAAAAWTTIGRMRLAADDTPGALQALQKGQAADPQAEGPALAALELMSAKLPVAETVVKKYLADNPMARPEFHMGYARVLLDAQRYADAGAQLQAVVRDKPGFAPAWLVLGSLQLQDNQLAMAQTSLERYVALSVATDQPQSDGDEPDRGLTQAYLSLAQIAEKRKDFAAAEGWLNKIENSDDMLQAQTRRASILASQGKLAEGRQLIRSLPERNAGDARLKLLAEVGLLRDVKQYQLAYTLLGKAVTASPQDTDLLYDQAMMAEKLGHLPDMERLLRSVIAIKPDAYNAYNALGYSFADRNMRLPEAKQLIQKALEFVPNDPFISDSLAWVEFRMGNNAEATKILADAFKTKPDAEIAAHYGEALWAMGQRDKAMSIWREGLLLNPENGTLIETLKRLNVKL
jgi:tetratricopeptide (TPR) repeat protein